jgi:hypothetical protein
MSIQYSTTLRNNQLDQVEATAGASAKLEIYDNSAGAPADCAAAATATKLVSIALPADWMSAAAAGAKAKLGTWSGTAIAGAAATPGYFRIVDNAGTTCHVQGTCGIGSGDLSLDGTVTSGQTVTINSFTLNAANA